MGPENARQQFLGAQERRPPAFPLTLTTADGGRNGDVELYTPCPGKCAILLLPLTLTNANRFSKLVQEHTWQKICGKAVIKYPTTP